MHQSLKQLDTLGNVNCAECGKITNMTAYGFNDQGDIVALCLECFEKSGRMNE